MDAQRQAQVAFYLTGRRLGAELEPVAGLGLRPALFAGYRDLGALRCEGWQNVLKQRSKR